MLGEPVPKGEFEDILKDGVVLCNLMNKLAPGSVKKIATKGTNFQLMENIQRFQAGMKAYGVPQEEIFQTADLFERRNIAQVSNFPSVHKSINTSALFLSVVSGSPFSICSWSFDSETSRVQRTKSGTKNG